MRGGLEKEVRVLDYVPDLDVPVDSRSVSGSGQNSFGPTRLFLETRRYLTQGNLDQNSCFDSLEP